MTTGQPAARPLAGHRVIDLTRFVSHDTLVTIVEDDPADENFALLRENSA